jgi:hypothetical protein
MPKRGPNKRVTYLFDYFDYNLFGIKLVNALRVGINEIFDRASVLTAHAHQACMSILEFCRLTKNGAHEQSILVTYFNH